MPCRRDSVGGGVVAEFFRDLGNAMRFSGGGVVSEIWRDLKNENAMRFSRGGGGVVAQVFRDLKINYAIRWGWGGISAEFFFSVTSKRHFTLMGPFFIFLLSRWGGPGPLAPPLNRPLHSLVRTIYWWYGQAFRSGSVYLIKFI